MPEPKTALIGHSTPELCAIAEELGAPALHGKILAQHLYKSQRTEIEQMQNLPKNLRFELANRYRISPLEIVRHQKSNDGVEKLLVQNDDQQVFECVLLPYEKRVSCCLSTQIGCPMACSFCATGLGGFQRNLSRNEIVAQYLLLQSLTERRISHVVFMGMGEPLLNFDELLASINILTDEIGLSMRHLTVSTVGIVPAIEKLADEKLQIHLALSLHSPFNEVRDKLMPVNHRWPVEVVWESMRKYHQATKRKVTIEYLLIDGVNDDDASAVALAALVKGTPSVINIIPFNWVDTGYGYRRPTDSRVKGFLAKLKKQGANATERIERGHDINGACGQLAGIHEGRFAKHPRRDLKVSK